MRVLRFPLYRRSQLGYEEARPGRTVNDQRSIVSALMVGLIVSKSLSGFFECATSRHLGLKRES